MTESGYYFVIVPATTVRAAPRPDAPILTRLARDTTVHGHEVPGEGHFSVVWVQRDDPDHIGYIRRGDLAFLGIEVAR